MPGTPTSCAKLSRWWPMPVYSTPPPAWNRLDGVVEVVTFLGATVRLSEKPSYYFRRQCFISADPDERTIPAMMQLVGEDKFFWASDYPHPDHPGNYLDELRAAGFDTTALGTVFGDRWSVAVTTSARRR